MEFPAITSPLPLAPPGMLGAHNNPLIYTRADSASAQLIVSQANEDQSSSNTRQAGAHELSQREQRQIAELKKTDREVRAHEAAHIAAAGGLIRGGANFSYTQGPDGQRYAVAGEVSIDTSAVHGNPEATLLKAQRIQAAALAPVQPSSADRAVAAGAAQMAASARAELLAQRLEADTAKDEKIGTVELHLAAVHHIQASENTEVTHVDGLAARKTQTHLTTELAQLIRQTTSAENRLGNLLNTTA